MREQCECSNCIRLGPAPISDAEQTRRRNRFVERFMAELNETGINPQWQAPKDAKDAYRNIADDWQVAYEKQSAELRDCRERLAALVAADDERNRLEKVTPGYANDGTQFAAWQTAVESNDARIHAELAAARDWLAAHPAGGGQDAGL